MHNKDIKKAESKIFAPPNYVKNISIIPLQSF